jgi:hypothetical protein
MLDAMRTTMLRAMMSTLVIAACDDAGGGTTPSSTATPPATTPPATTTPPSKPADVPAPAAARSYAQPPNVCTVADASLLGAEAGKPNEGYVEKEDTKFAMNGCIIDMVAPDAINTLKLFVAVDGDAAARYAQSDELWNGQFKPPGYVQESIAELGTKAVYAVRLTAENRRIEQALALYDGNLYIEARFMGGGSKEWDATAMRERVLTLVRDAMGKVPRA